MKKFAAISMMWVYVLLSLGIRANLHYCMGELAAINYQVTKGPFCVCDSGEADAAPADCCDNETLDYSLDDSQQSHFAWPGPAAQVLALPPQSPQLAAPVALAAQVQARQPWPLPDAAPPSAVPLYLRHCVLMI